MTQTNSAAVDATPEALPSFDVIPLSAAVRRAVDELGFSHPTPVQRACFEPAAAGRDMVVQARTGTGKTAAFGLPIVDRLVKTDDDRTQTLILAPTRELALQISRQLEQLAAHTGIRVTAIYGGAAMQPQIDALQSGVHIVVGTPGRVLDHLERRTLHVNGLRTLVLDESDEMLSMGFLPQITAIMEQLPPNKQILLFSATVPPAVRRIAESRLTNPEYVTLSGDHIGALEIDHYVYTSRGDKAGELIQIIEIENPESAIVFCNTRDQTKRIATALQKQGFAADWLNADLSQSDRERVMLQTRESKLRFLVCTDVAARGIDISHLTHVINADFPDSTENYVHRTGRTGRAGRTGTAISLIAPQDVGNLYMLRVTYKIFPLARELPSARDLQTRKEADLVEFLAAAFPRNDLRDEDLSLSRRVLSSELAPQILAGLLRDHLGARPNSTEHAAEARREKSPPAEKREAPRNEKRDKKPSRDRKGPRRDGEREASRDREPRHDREPSRELASNGAADTNEFSYSVSDEIVAPTADAVPVAQPAEAPAPASPAPERSTSSENGGSPRELLNDEESIERIFVDVGRRDGAYREDFIGALEQQGFVATDVHFVKIRDTHSFVGVKVELLERALSVLDGATIAGCAARAERARGTGANRGA